MPRREVVVVAAWKGGMPTILPALISDAKTAKEKKKKLCLMQAA